MGFINTALTAIEDQLKTLVPSEVQVKQHPGRFTEDELSKTLIKRKAVRLAIEGFEKQSVQGNGIRMVQARFIAHVICSDIKGEDRHTAALDIVEQLVGVVAYAQWGDEAIFNSPVSPASIEVTNLYSGDLSNGKGIAWWSISWVQAIRNN